MNSLKASVGTSEKKTNFFLSKTLIIYISSVETLFLTKASKFYHKSKKHLYCCFIFSRQWIARTLGKARRFPIYINSISIFDNHVNNNHDLNYKVHLFVWISRNLFWISSKRNYIEIFHFLWIDTKLRTLYLNVERHSMETNNQKAFRHRAKYK